MLNGVDLLEHGGGHMHVRIGGELIPMPDPRTKNYQWVLMCLKIGHVPGTPNVPEWQRVRVFQRWCAAWDLPGFEDARRLTYLVDNYRAAISNDLAVHAGADLGTLWRARRWTFLLDVIDRLPGHSWYAATVSMDEKHAEMLAASIAERRASGDAAENNAGPPLTSWTPEVAALTNVLDAVRGVQHAIVAVNSEKGKMPKPPQPSARPRTPLENAIRVAEHRHRKAKHEALVARLVRKRD